MQNRVCPCILSQVKCHNSCGFKENVNFVSSCSMETQAKVVLPIYRITQCLLL